MCDVLFQAEGNADQTKHNGTKKETESGEKHVQSTKGSLSGKLDEMHGKVFLSFFF